MLSTVSSIAVTFGIFTSLSILQDYQICLIRTSYCSEMFLNRAFLMQIWSAMLVK